MGSDGNLLAVNYSHQARLLVEACTVNFDRWKCSPPGTDGAFESIFGGDLLLYVHFPFDAGDPNLARTDWDEVERILDATHTPLVNVHLNAKKPFFDGASDSNSFGVIRERFLRSLDAMVKRFGAERVVAENVIYRGEAGQYLRPSVDPRLISEVIAEAGCLFLLDMAHAVISCSYLGEAHVDRYISALPCDLLGELHITGAVHDGNRLRDSMPLTECDWDLAQWCIQNAFNGSWRKPWVTSLEYGGIGPTYDWRNDPVVIESELRRLGTLLGKHSPNLTP